MAAERVLVDAGPLVALLNQRDAAHDLCTAAIRKLPRPLITTWLVLAEAAWLLRRTQNGQVRLLEMVTAGVIKCPALDEQAADSMARWLAKYADLNPQLADISLLYLAEREQIDSVFTLDQRDFSVFRVRHDRPLTLLPQHR